MMRAARTLLAAAGMMVFLCTYAAHAADQHACTGSDLPHNTYKMLLLRESPPRQEADWVANAPYHYLSFLDGTNYTFVASDRELKTPAEAQKVMTWPQTSNHTLIYRLGDQGVLDLYLDKALKYHYRCVVVDTTTKNGYKKGDLILTAYIPHPNGQLSYVFKWYRRWY